MKTWVATLALASVLGGVAEAQVQPIVHVQLTPETVIVGEFAEMRVTVLVPTWFARPPVYPNFELANAITRLPADSSYPTSERVGNETWSGIVRNYRVYPLLGATYRLRGQTMRVAYANPGADPVTLDIDVPEIVFRGSVPAGAEDLDPYIAGSDLSLALDVEGELKGLEAGDAVVLSYRAELDGLPAIFLPPLAPDLELEGVSIYGDIPEVQDEERARRVEKITLVFNAGGEFAIPGMELHFWNTESRSVETAVAEGIVISVQGLPAAATVNDELTERRWLHLVGLVVGSVALILVLWHGVPVVVRRYREAMERHRQTEGYAFSQLVSALGSNDSETAYRKLLLWIARLEPGMKARDFALNYGDESLYAAIDALSAGIYSDARGPSDLRRIRKKLEVARKRYLERGSARRTMPLPPMNP